VVLDVGFQPDMVTFSADGTKLFVANEAETLNTGATTVNAPGSLSIIDLTGITGIGDVGSLSGASVSTFDFSSANLGAGVSLAGFRNPSVAALGTSGPKINSVPNFNTLGGTGAGSDPDFYKGFEPEYISQSGSKLYVSLQENNAVGVFDLTTNKWEAIHKLGTITQTIDASDRDGAGGGTAALIDDVVKGMPMPDNLATYTVAGKTYFVTANEGDARTDDRDVSRLGTTSGDDNMSTLLDSGIPASVRANSALGRLNVSRIDGDTNGDGTIDDPIMFGARSFSIWDGDTGALVWDSGSGNGNRNDPTVNLSTNIESLILVHDPTRFNINAESSLTSFDSRSGSKGPEPEGITIGVIDGRTYAFLGLERQNGLMMYDITDPVAPFFVDYIQSGLDGLIAPESLFFIPAADSPSGHAMLLAGYEISNGIGVYTVPEPSSAMLLVSAFGVLGLRRRRG
jgi:hypothetical protein